MRVWGIQGVFVDETVKPLQSNRDVEIVYDIGLANVKILLKYVFYRFFGADTGYVYLRRRVVEIVDPRVLSQLDSGEDLYMAQEIVQKGLLYIRYKRLRAHHYGGLKTSLEWKKLVRRAFNPHGLAYYLNSSALFG